MKHYQYLMQYIIITVVLVLLILVSSCNKTRQQQVFAQTTGNEGVVLQFTKNSPPDKVLEGNKLYPSIEVWNKGSYDLVWGGLYLNTDDKAIRLTQKKKEIVELYGKSLYTHEGDSMQVLFDEYAPVRVPFGMSYTPILSANLCYGYVTHADPTVCILPTTEELLKKTSVCRPDAQSFPAGQGAPIALAKLETEPMVGSVTFVATIQNRGNGQVIFDESLREKCPYQLTLNDIDLVKVQMRVKGLPEPECYPSNNIVRLADGRGVITCTFRTRQPQPYTTPLNIDLSYGYATSIQKQVQILSTAEDFEESFEEYPSSMTPAPRVTSSTECTCEEPNKPCLCVRLNSQELKRCLPGATAGTPLVAREGKNTISVYPDDASVRTCVINSQAGPCHENREIELHSVGGRGAVLYLTGLDYMNRRVATGTCAITFAAVGGASGP